MSIYTSFPSYFCSKEPSPPSTSSVSSCCLHRCCFVLIKGVQLPPPFQAAQLRLCFFLAICFAVVTAASVRFLPLQLRLVWFGSSYLLAATVGVEQHQQTRLHNLSSHLARTRDSSAVVPPLSSRFMLGFGCSRAVTSLIFLCYHDHHLFSL